MLAERYVTGAYLEEVPDWPASAAPWKADKIRALLKKHALFPRSVCDVGCGAGGILSALQPHLPHGCSLWGFDISPAAIRLAKEKENPQLRFACADLTALEPEAKFDLLLLLDVMEHAEDYLGLLRSLLPRAKRFVFHIPLELNVHALWRRSSPLLEMRRRYGHLHHFSRETALATLEDAGFVVEDAVYTWDHEPDGLFPPRAPGLRGLLRYPARVAAVTVERWAHRRRPDLTAALRPAYNLLVLARASTPAR